MLEATVVSGLMTVLAVILSSAWAGFGRPTTDVITRARVFREMSLAADCLARDLGGSLANNEARIGGKKQAAFVGWLLPGDGQLWLCFDGGATPNSLADWASPDTTIVYMQEGDRLVRWDQNANTTFTAARNLAAMELRLLGDELYIDLTFKYRNITRTCTLVARTP
jgi:hypothetical protein